MLQNLQIPATARLQGTRFAGASEPDDVAKFKELMQGCGFDPKAAEYYEEEFRAADKNPDRFEKVFRGIAAQSDLAGFPKTREEMQVMLAPPFIKKGFWNIPAEGLYLTTSDKNDAVTKFTHNKVEVYFVTEADGIENILSGKATPTKELPAMLWSQFLLTWDGKSFNATVEQGPKGNERRLRIRKQGMWG